MVGGVGQVRESRHQRPERPRHDPPGPGLARRAQQGLLRPGRRRFGHRPHEDPAAPQELQRDHRAHVRQVGPAREEARADQPLLLGAEGSEQVAGPPRSRRGRPRHLQKDRESRGVVVGSRDHDAARVVVRRHHDQVRRGSLEAAQDVPRTDRALGVRLRDRGHFLQRHLEPRGLHLAADVFHGAAVPLGSALARADGGGQLEDIAHRARAVGGGMCRAGEGAGAQQDQDGEAGHRAADPRDEGRRFLTHGRA